MKIRERRKENEYRNIIRYHKIVVETDEQDPKIIAVITAEDIDSAEGFRVRITPKYD